MTESITFKPSPADAAAAALALTPRKWGRYERLRLVLGGISLMLLVFFLIASYNWKTWGLFILRWDEVLAFSFAGAIMGWLYGRRRPVLMADNDPRLEQRTMTLTADGYEVEGPGFRNRVDWTAVEQIATRDDIILFMTQWKDVQFVPKRVFASVGQANNFERAARDAWSARWEVLDRKSGEAR